MKTGKNKRLWPGFIMAVSLFAASLTSLLVLRREQHVYTYLLGEICEKIVESQPEAEGAIAAVLKEHQRNLRRPDTEPGSADWQNTTFFAAYGYQANDVFPSPAGRGIIYAFSSFLMGSILVMFILRYKQKQESARINQMITYLEKVNAGENNLLFSIEENDFSKLQDELYKTVTQLQQTRESALTARNNFAENLSNIAHQLKTPITSISLSLQMMENEAQIIRREQKIIEREQHTYILRIRQQLDRLAHLEDALLVLSRIDAGTLAFDQKAVDVFTLLTLAADNLQEVFAKADVSADIPELGEMMINVDLDWTMEAMMNLWKNCIEHTSPGGIVHCTYEQNPLYTQIQIWDTGTGFAKEDMPYLFDRFYRGKETKNKGIGIGLAIAKEIIESQNGTIRALNPAGGGACFEIRFYNK